MKITVDVHRRRLVSLEVRPSLLGRLFGQRTREGMAAAVPDVNGGTMWIWDNDSTPVDGSGAERTPIADEINRVVALAVRGPS